MFKIGNVKIKNKIVLAPMAGTSNPAYIKICEEMGLGYAVTELISSEAIVRANKKTNEMLNGFGDIEIPCAIQLFGSNPKTMGEAARIIYEKYKPKIIDINMGCPVPKVAVKSNAGSALLKDLNIIRAIVSEVVNSVPVPVTVKIRSGWDKENINAVEVAKVCENAGASAIAIHARTRSQGYSGIADWNIIKKVKEAVNIPVVGNGDIKTIYDAKKMLEETNCDGIMIGRSALSNPWLIKECLYYLENGKELEKPSDIEKIDMIKKHYELLKKYSNEKNALLEIRTHAIWYLKGIPGLKQYKNNLMNVKCEEDFFVLLNELKKYT